MSPYKLKEDALASIQIKRKEWDENAKKYSHPCGSVARCRDEKELPARVRFISDILDLSSKSFESILDVGCGNGYLLSKIKHHFIKVYGVDFSENMIRDAMEYCPEGFFSISHANILPFKDNKFEIVLCESIFHYFPNQEYALTVIKELIRVCKQDGHILVGDLLDKEKKDNVPKEYVEKMNSSDRPSIHRFDDWRFYDVEELLKFIYSRGYEGRIIEQPTQLYSSHYRVDLLIKKKSNERH